MSEENLKERWKEIDRRNAEVYNKRVKKTKILSVIILTIMLLVNLVFTTSVFLSNLIPLGIAASAFGLVMATLYFFKSVKPAFKEPYRIYDPASNPIS